MAHCIYRMKIVSGGTETVHYEAGPLPDWKRQEIEDSGSSVKGVTRMSRDETVRHINSLRRRQHPNYKMAQSAFDGIGSLIGW